MPNDNTQTAPEDKRARRGFAIVAMLALLTVIVLLCWSALEYYAIMSENSKDATAPEIPRKAQLYRDITIFFLAIIGIGMAFWRNFSLDEQSKAANKQANLANTRLYSDQFASAAELMGKENKLGNPLMAARIGGIDTMADLAIKQSEEFAPKVVSNLIAYIKDNAQITAIMPPENSETPANIRILGGDVKAAFSALSNILDNKAIKKHIASELLNFSQADFSGLDFAGIHLQHYKGWVETNFSGCDLTCVRFVEGAYMHRVNFSDAILHRTALIGVDLKEADFRGANLVHTDMRGACLMMAQMQGCFIRFAELQQTDKGKRTNLLGVQLAGANLAGVDLTGANMESVSVNNVERRTDIRGAVFSLGTNLTDVEGLFTAEFGETYMVDIIIDKDNESMLLKKAQGMDRKFWFSRIHTYGQVGDNPQKINWHLEEYEDGYALAGVLINFANATFPEHFDPPIKVPLSEEMLENVQWKASELVLDELPKNTPEAIRRWLKKIKEVTSEFIM